LRSLTTASSKTSTSAVLLILKRSVHETATALVLLPLVAVVVTHQAREAMITTIAVLEATAHVGMITIVGALHHVTTMTRATAAMVVLHLVVLLVGTTHLAHHEADTMMHMVRLHRGRRRTRIRTRMGMELMADRTQLLPGAVAQAELHPYMRVEAMTVRVTELDHHHPAKLIGEPATP
jgi:uncharacterized membrane protein